MIAYLEGSVLAVDEQKIIIKTQQGLGYEVFYRGNATKKAALYITQVIKEKAIELYGFESFDEKKFFEQLLSVNGVGPKSAYSLISTLGEARLRDAIFMEDVATIKKAPGIGPKAAKQIILDLKGKLGTFKTRKESLKITEEQEDYSIMYETMSAFNELGFSDSEVLPIVKKSLETGNFEKSEDLIKAVLRQMNQ
ncbi:MAG: Holliday junction branch migration protein RuvA [Halobacteriovoraceae bacterium]|nr:Holliday junction branch migration protein RuvA [Halobacteriovoraceae bacterium]